jgi:DNA ligase-1
MILLELPTDVTLDGELFGGRGEFQSTVSIVKTMNSPHWKGITFQVHTLCLHSQSVPLLMPVHLDIRHSFAREFPVRRSHVILEGTLWSWGFACPEIVLVEHEKAKNKQHVLDKLKEIETLGGEGLMLRKPGSSVLSFWLRLSNHGTDPGVLFDKSVYEGHRSASLLKIKVCTDYV